MLKANEYSDNQKIPELLSYSFSFKSRNFARTLLFFIVKTNIFFKSRSEHTYLKNNQLQTIKF